LLAVSPYTRRSFGVASSPIGTRPPIAPMILDSHAMADLLPNSDDDDCAASDDVHFDHANMNKPPLHQQHQQISHQQNQLHQQQQHSQPPSFNDLVKRSTRFITAVPAAEVLVKVQTILEECKALKTATPAGVIGRIDLNWNNFKLEMWGIDDTPFCALQLYQFSSDMSPSPSSLSFVTNDGTATTTSPSFSFTSPSLSPHALTARSIQMPGLATPPELFLAEFVRGQIEIFAFKRFYEWLRQQLCVLVKRDYTAMNLFEPSISPKVDYQLLQRFQKNM